jgi:hypothetical protein
MFDMGALLVRRGCARPGWQVNGATIAPYAAITNVYSKTVINYVTRLSVNVGTGGTAAQPTPQEQAAAREQHVVGACRPVPVSRAHLRRNGRVFLFSVAISEKAVITNPLEAVSRNFDSRTRRARPGNRREILLKLALSCSVVHVVLILRRSVSKRPVFFYCPF